MILVDSNVLIDLIESSSHWGEWSETQLNLASESSPLAINAIVYAEIARTFSTQAGLDAFLDDVRVECLPVPNAAAYLASVAHRAYRLAGGARNATLPDFFIAAHAQVKNFSLLTRDATRVRRYFPRVTLITP